MCAMKRSDPPVAATILGRWPRIQHALTIRDSGGVDCDYCLVIGHMDRHEVHGAERARTCEELAEFYEWRLTTRAGEMAEAPRLRFLLETWTDSMCYALRRSAAYARGDDPGPAVEQSQRRPDLFAYRGVVGLAG